MQKKDVVSVVIIEDYKLTRVGLKSTLNEYKHINVIGEAEDAAEGIKLIEELKPDVVLMDLGLPGMNGLEATIKLKEKSASSKIIVLTSHERSEEVIVSEGACWVDAGVSSAALNFFPKPENVTLIHSTEVQDARAQLTERELEVLKHLVKGKSNTEIAKELIVSVHTAKAHVCSILQKLCVDDRVQAAVKAIKENII